MPFGRPQAFQGGLPRRRTSVSDLDDRNDGSLFRDDVKLKMSDTDVPRENCESLMDEKIDGDLLCVPPKGVARAARHEDGT